MTGHRRVWLAVALTALAAVAWPSLAAAQDPANAGAPAQSSAADDQYGEEVGPAGNQPQEPNVFQPPSATSEPTSEGALPLTGAELLIPTALGVGLLAAGLALLYRTRRRES